MTQFDIAAAVFAALSSVPALGARVYPDMVPQSNTAWPAARYQIISAAPDVTVCGTDEAGDDVRVQVDVFAADHDTAAAVRIAAITAMQEITTFTVHRSGDNSLPFDEDARLFRRSIDFICSLSNV